MTTKQDYAHGENFRQLFHEALAVRLKNEPRIGFYPGYQPEDNNAGLIGVGIDIGKPFEGHDFGEFSRHGYWVSGGLAQQSSLEPEAYSSYVTVTYAPNFLPEEENSEDDTNPNHIRYQHYGLIGLYHIPFQNVDILADIAVAGLKQHMVNGFTRLSDAEES